MNANDSTRPPAWVHWIAVATVILTLPLLLLGAEVTTKGVGMVDKVSVRDPFYLIRQLLENGVGWVLDQGLGWIIEHSHRLAGWLVGMFAIATVLAIWYADSRRWVKWLSVAALAAVCIQGLLGIFRVQLDILLGRNLAFVHGSFAPIVVALLSAVAYVTSRGYFTSVTRGGDSKGIERWANWCVAVVYVQLVLGGMTRHWNLFTADIKAAIAGRLHVIWAFVAVGVLLRLIRLAWETDKPRYLRTLMILKTLLVMQVLLGTEIWMKWSQRLYLGGEAESTATHLMRSSHYVIGALIFATTVVLMIKAHQRPTTPTEPA